MKTPKEKALELIDKFYQIIPTQISRGTERTLTIECAKVAVDELIQNTDMYLGNLNPKWRFWQDVKKEIEKM